MVCYWVRESHLKFNWLQSTAIEGDYGLELGSVIGIRFNRLFENIDGIFSRTKFTFRYHRRTSSSALEGSEDQNSVNGGKESSRWDRELWTHDRWLRVVRAPNYLQRCAFDLRHVLKLCRHFAATRAFRLEIPPEILPGCRQIGGVFQLSFDLKPDLNHLWVSSLSVKHDIKFLRLKESLNHEVSSTRLETSLH